MKTLITLFFITLITLPCPLHFVAFAQERQNRIMEENEVLLQQQLKKFNKRKYQFAYIQRAFGSENEKNKYFGALLIHLESMIQVFETLEKNQASVFENFPVVINADTSEAWFFHKDTLYLPFSTDKKIDADNEIKNKLLDVIAYYELVGTRAFIEINREYASKYPGLIFTYNKNEKTKLLKEFKKNEYQIKVIHDQISSVRERYGKRNYFVYNKKSNY
ncbi:MAG: hypothetical protein R3A45_03805 [Bdellovibrionota bacterium]